MTSALKLYEHAKHGCYCRMNRILMKQKTKGENFLEPPSGTGV
jgi:hypothetical protein